MIIQTDEVHNDPTYRTFLKEFPEASLESVEAILQFQKVATTMNMRRDAKFMKYGLTAGRFHLMMLLKTQDSHALSPSELALKTNVTRGTMTQFIDALEKEGYVKREMDPHDKRGTLVKLSESGEEKLQEILPRHLKQMEHFIEIFTKEERSQFLALMEKLAAGLKDPQEY